jgi:hypothetical protein
MKVMFQISVTSFKNSSIPLKIATPTCHPEQSAATSKDRLERLRQAANFQKREAGEDVQFRR